MTKALQLQNILAIGYWFISVCFCHLVNGHEFKGIPPNNHGIEPQVLINQETLVSKSNLITKIPILSPEFSVTFKMRVVGQSNGWATIVRFTDNQGEDANSFGTRNPLAQIDTGLKILYISSGVNNNPDHNVKVSFEMNQTYYVEIHQRYVEGGLYRYSVNVDGVQKHTIINSNAKQYYNAHVYASGPLYPAANAYIHDFKLTNYL